MQRNVLFALLHLGDKLMPASIALFKKCFILFAVLIVFSSGRVFAAQQAENLSFYQDPKTGLKIVAGDVALEGWYLPVQLESDAAVTQLGWVSVSTPKDENGERIDFRADSEKFREAKRTYRLGGLLRDPGAASVVVKVYRPSDKTEETIILNLAEAQKHKGTAEDFEGWAKQRQSRWNWMTNSDGPPAMVTEIWRQKGQQVYGVEFHTPYSAQRAMRSEMDSELDIGTMAVFGGQVAINETLQTQLLDHDPNGAPEGKPSIAVQTIPGVGITSYPYDKMVRNLAMTPPSLAWYVPTDRLMALVSKPERFADLFDIDSSVLARLASFGGSGFVNYDLLERYTARFGATPKQVKSWLASGIATEIAVFTPDVFFLDSTDVTLVIRLDANVAKLAALASNAGAVISMPVEGGKPFYISIHRDLLLASTSKSELESVLPLVKKNGEGSLGRSDEFRVISHELPLQTDAGIYVYFSDAFIRRLTGPEVKINQLRRALTRAQMQNIAATSLLYRLDQGKDGSLADMKKKGYLLEEEAPASEFTLEPGAVVRSKVWGSLGRLNTLMDNPLKTVSQAEAAAYNDYLDHYTDFWHDYFDPIAVRLDLSAKNELSLETFILPLIDNSYYNSLKEALGTQKPNGSLMPLYNAPPVMSLALQIPMQSASRKVEDEFGPLTYQMMPILKGLGDAVVFSVQDNAPVLQASYPGSLAELNGDGGRMFGFGGEELLMVPLISALLSRPVDLAFEIRDEAVVRKALESLFFPDQEYFKVEQVTYEADGSRVLTVSLMGMIRMELSLKIEQGWLHVSNHPWSPVSIVGNRKLPPSQAVIEVTPSAVKKGWPQTAAMLQSIYRNAVYTSSAELLPWMIAFDVDEKTAASMQEKALGRSTPLPPEVTLDAVRLFEAKPYGSWRRQTMPINADQIINLTTTPDVRLWMRFEDGGLRSRMEFVESIPVMEDRP